VVAPLVVLCAYLVIELVATLATEPNFPAVRFPENPESPLSASAVFPPSPGGAIADLDDTSLDAELVGVVDGDSRSLAIITLDGGEASVYREGDELSTSVVIEAIAGNQVAVREGGQLRRIPLRTHGDGALIDVVAGARSGTASPSGAFDAVAKISGGTMAGIEIRQVEAAGELPLRTGDVISHIAGYPVAMLVSDGETVRDLLAEDIVEVVLSRDGESRTIQVEGAMVRDWADRALEANFR
jgi:hypothetical protein